MSLLMLLCLLTTAAAGADPEARRFEVLGGMIEIGAVLETEEPDQVLELIDGLYQAPVVAAPVPVAAPIPEDLELELSLVGAEAARQAGLPARGRQFLERARALQGQASGSARVAVQWLLESYELQDLCRRDPERARRELLRRTDGALDLLRGYHPDLAERNRWSLAQAPLGQAFAIWLEALVSHAAGLPGAEERLARMLDAGETLVREWGRPDPADPNSARLAPWIGLTQARLQALRRLDQDDPLVTLLDPTADQRDLEAQARLLSQGLQAVLGAEAPTPGQVAAALLGPAKARLDLQEVRWLCRRARGRTFTPEESARVRDLLRSSATLAAERGSLALVHDLYLTGVTAAFHSSKPGWQPQAERILAGIPPSLEKSRPDLVRVLTLRGRLHLLQGRPTPARADLERAVGLLEALVQETGGTPAASEQIRAEARETYELLTRLQVEAGQSAQAFQTVARFQQVESACLFRTEDLAPGSGLEARQERLRSLEVQNAVAPERAAEYARARQQVQSDQARLREAHPALDRLTLRPVDLPGLQSRLPEDTVLVQLFPGEDRVYLFAVTRGKLDLQEVRIPRTELEDCLARVRQEASRPAAAFTWESTRGRELAGLLARLYEVTLRPLEAALEGHRQVILAPSGALLYVPWAALRRDDGRFLIQQHALVTVTRTAELERLLDQGPAPSRALVALGNPDGSLPGAESEVRALKALFPDSQIFLQDEADRRALAAGGGAGMLHLATHGVLNRRDPAESFLVLAAGERLRVGDLPSLSLEGVNLVSLSACQTALGERTPGAQLRSLAEGFGLAGGRTVLATLWQIDDASTPELMRVFYGGLARALPKAEALRQAQVALLGNAATAHPYHWAAFVLFGDFR